MVGYRFGVGLVKPKLTLVSTLAQNNGLFIILTFHVKQIPNNPTFTGVIINNLLLYKAH
jgi:hypothetical protein